MKFCRSIFVCIIGVLFLVGVPSVASAQVTIHYGDCIKDSIVPVGKVNTYLFTATAGDIITVLMGTTSFSFHPRIEVYSPSGTLLKTSIDSAAFTSARIDTLKLAVSGTYTILGLDCCAENGGGYGLSLQRVNPAQNGKISAYGSTVTDTLKSAGSLRGFTFTATASDIVTISIAAPDFSFRPKIELYTPAGVLLRKATDTTSWSSNRISLVQLPSTGTYTILGMDLVGVNPGRFTINVSKVNTPVNLTSGSIKTVSFGLNQVTAGTKTSIAYSLPRTMQLSLSLVSVTGRNVAVLASGTSSAGMHTVSLNAGIPSGVYFCRLQAPGHEETMKLGISR